MEEKEQKIMSVKLMREVLSSIDLSDIAELKEDITEDEEKTRAGDVETFYKLHFERVIKILIQKQLEFVGKQAENDLQLAFGRGTINGLTLIDEWLQKQVKISLSRFDKEEELEEPMNPFPPL